MSCRLSLPAAVLAAATLFFGAAQTAQAHGGGPPAGGLTAAAAGSAEGKLREFETAALGADHAAAHAYQRQVARAAQPRAARSGASGARAVVAPRDVPLQEGGSWTAPQPLPVVAINAVMLATGKVLIYAYPHRPLALDDPSYEDLAHAYVWDPATGVSKQVDPPFDETKNPASPANIFCSGASVLADGRVLITGGNLGSPFQSTNGLSTVFTFNPFTETWARHPNMRQGRWYPTQVLMPNGDTLIAGGTTKPGDPDFTGTTANNDLEVFSPGGSLGLQTGFFNGAGDPPLSGLYPRMFWMPSGRALAAGPYSDDTWFLNPPAAAGGTWGSSDAADMSRTREWGSAVLLEGGRIMTLGGSELDEDGDGERPGTNSTEFFDESGAATWSPGPDLHVARSHANGVLLPGDDIAIIGGGYGEDSNMSYYRWLASDDDLQPEIYHAATGTSTLGNPQLERRTYHSTALLLPDARVMSAGDDINGTPTGGNPTGAGLGTDTDTAEIWSPPYLFAGDGSPAPRPVIDSAPATITLGTSFLVQASGPAATKAVLIAPGASTHAFDMSQRRVALGAPQPAGGGGLSLQAPTSANVAPPGYYMLFLLTAGGVPSVAKFVHVDAPAAPPPPPPPPPPPIVAKLALSGALPSMRTLKRRKSFKLTVTLSEPGKVTLSALLDRGRTKSGKSLATRKSVTFTKAGRRRITFKLTRAGLRLLAHRRTAIVRIKASAKLTSRRTVAAVQIRRKVRR